MVVGSVVRRQGDNWIGQSPLPLSDLDVIVRSGVERHSVPLTLSKRFTGSNRTRETRCASANAACARRAHQSCSLASAAGFACSMETICDAAFSIELKQCKL